MPTKHTFPSFSDVADDIYIQYVENSQRTDEPHTHPFFQVFFLIKGKLTHHIGGLSADMSVGEMAIIPPNVPHYITLENAPSFYSFSFNLSVFGEINTVNEQVITFLRSLQDIGKTILPKTSIADGDVLHIQSLFERIYKEYDEKEIGFKESIVAYGTLLITQFIRRYHLTNISTGKGSYTGEQMVLNCIKYIDGHFTEELTLNELSHLSALSPSTFCACFNRITGVTFNTYLNERRIKYATELIKKGYKITAVSSFCGYNDFATFSRNFKKIIGISPREYQRINKQKPYSK